MKKLLLFFSATLLSFGVFAQIASYVPQNGLVLYLPFNGNYNDLSPTNTTVTPFGGTFAADQFGNPNKVYKCAQGENLEIAVSGTSALKPRGDFSISLWVNYEGVILPFNNINYATLVEYGSSSYYLRYFENSQNGPVVDVQAGYKNSDLNGGVFSGVAYNIKNTYQPYPGWTHITYTATTRGSIMQNKIYVNGTLVSIETSSGSVVYSSSDILSIGGIRGTTLNDVKRFAGSLDDIAIYSRALSDQEISSLYTGYKNENGKKEAYLSFDGNTNYVEVATPLNLNSNNVIIEAQVYFDATTNANDGIVVSRDGNTIAGLIVQNIVNQGTGVRLGYMWNGLHYDWTGGPVVSYNEWHSVRLIINPSYAILYADSTFGRNNVAHAIEEFDGKLLFGDDGFGTSRRFHGNLDEIRVWKDYDINVLNRVVNGTGGVCPLNVVENPQLVAYYTFNQGDEISPTTAPSIVKDKLGLRDGVLKGYVAQPVGSWFYGGPIIDIDFEISAYPIIPNILSALEQKATSYTWYKQAFFDELQNGETSRSFTATTNGTYYARIAKGACTVNSNPIVVSNFTITGLTDNSNTSSIQFYPNPSRGLVTLTKDVDGVKVYSTQGQLLLRATGKEIDLRSLSKGSYILKIENQQETSTHKLILE